MSELQILTSAGQTGPPEVRSDERWYQNAPNPWADIDALTRNWTELKATIPKSGTPDNPGKRISRVALRGVANSEVLEGILLDSKLNSDLEAAVSLDGEDNNFLIYIARNATDRRTSRSTIDHIREHARDETQVALTMSTSPIDRVKRILDNDGEVITSIDPDDEATLAQLHELWGNTFGWKRAPGHDEIKAFAERLKASQNMNPSERNLWFTGVKMGELLVSANMVEGITFNDNRGNEIPIFESTEWATRPEYDGRGYGVGAICFSNAQVLYDRPEGEIIAETRFDDNHAVHIPAGMSGLTIPSRYSANQILRRNVTVDGALRDFNVTRMTPEVKQGFYSPKDNEAIMELVKG